MAVVQTDVTPLRRLGQMLVEALPVGLNALAGWTERGQFAIEFVRLVDAFVPDARAAIMAEATEWERCLAFAHEFEKHYFPIAEVEEYEWLLRGIPFYYRGVTADDHHDPEAYRLGLMLQVALLDQRDVGGEDGARVVLLESLAKLEPGLQAELERIPPDGFALEELRNLVAGTRFASVAAVAAWWSHATGNGLLDGADDDGYEAPEWGADTVENITRLWREADDVMDPADELADWLEAAPLAHFAEMVATLLGQKGIAYDGPNARDIRDGWQLLLPWDWPGRVGAAAAAAGEPAGC